MGNIQDQGEIFWQVRAGHWVSRGPRPIGKVMMRITGANGHLLCPKETSWQSFKKIRDQVMLVLSLIGDRQNAGVISIFLFGLNNLKLSEKTDEDKEDTRMVSGCSI